MLPSTGLFKNFPCPFFDGSAGVLVDGKGFCERPYCHFKHVRPDDKRKFESSTVKAPEYIPTPKLLTLPQLTTSAASTPKRIEYCPEKPGLNASPLNRSTIKKYAHAPVYKPAPTSNGSSTQSIQVDIDLADCEEELNEISDIVDTHFGHVESERNQGISEEKSALKIPEETATVKKREGEKPSKDDELHKDQKYSAKSSSIKEYHHKKDRQESKNTSSSSKHKHKSSKTKERSSSRERRSSKESERRHDKDKHKERDRERDKAKERHRSKEKEHSSKNKEHRSSKSGSGKTSLNSTHSSRSKHKSSSSSSRIDEKSEGEKSIERKNATSTRSDHSLQSSASLSIQPSTSKEEQGSHVDKFPSLYASSTDADADLLQFNFDPTDENIMKECEMIYDQLEQEFANMNKEKSEMESNGAVKRQLSAEDKNEVVDVSGKKRVAYENASKTSARPHLPVPHHKPNHIRNAVQAMFERQNVLRREQIERTAAAQNALREAEQRVNEANEALRKAKEETLTPLVPRSYRAVAIRPPRPIPAVANVLALERAKKKVEELRAEKKAAFTPSQTAKGTARVAHKPTAALEAGMGENQLLQPPVLDANSSKISFNLRMQYYEMMIKHCTAIYPNIADVWQRAQAEELAVLKKCNSPIIYKSSAMLTINKLRKEATESGNKPPSSKLISHEVVLAGKMAKLANWSVENKRTDLAKAGGEPFDKLSGESAYNMVYNLHLTEEQLVGNGFPRAGKGPGTAVITHHRPNRRPNETERYCSRCGKVFSLTMYDEICVDECNYHPKSTGYRRGFADHQHRCCQQPSGTPGCTYANYHVTDYIDLSKLNGFVTTIDKDEGYVPTKKDIFALDCEMCYTTHGIELTRVTVVDINARTVYDALVKPDNKIVDYNTIFSGITEQMLANETRTLRDVQAILMSMFHSKTVLVGHSLESDLKALKLIHSVVVDTSVLFPHKMGPPKKRALKTLCIENLKRIIQENEAGHDSAEDAEVCIQLIKFYLRNKIV